MAPLRFPLGPPGGAQPPPWAPQGPLGALLGFLLGPPGLHWLVWCPLGAFTQSLGDPNIAKVL